MLKKTFLTASIVAMIASSNAIAVGYASADNKDAGVVMDSTAAQPVTSADQQAVVSTANLEVKDVWARASVASSKNSAAYLKLVNPTNEDIIVIAATAPNVANNVELHNSFVDEKGVTKMTKVDKIVVPANSSVEMVPGGMHIMLFNLKNNLKAGDKFDINVILEGRDPIAVQGEVKAQ